MLQGLLYALHGHTGSIFKEGSNGEVKIVPGLPHLSPFEESAINRLLKLSTRVIFLKKFSETHKRINLKDNEGKHCDGLLHGLYLSAFCNGLDEVLRSYFQKLLDIEEKVLADPLLTYMFLIQHLEEYHLLFDALQELISTIRSQRSHGCQILNNVHAASQNGNSLIQKAMLDILQKLHVVMYNQIATFVIHGMLLDRNKEFFIAKTEEANMEDIELNFNATSLTCLSESKLDPRYSLYASRSRDSEADFFHIRAEMLPSYIPTRVAEIILFVGSSLNLFERDVVNQRSDSENFSRDEVGGIPKEKEREFMDDILWLQKRERFSLEEFESRLNKIRSLVAKELWELCVVRAKLVSHLTNLKDFFLLGLGELYLVFLEKVSKLMRKPPSKMTEHDVNQAFQRSAVTVLLEEDGPLQNFKLTIQDKAVAGEDPGPYPYDASSIMDTGDTWSLLGMTFKVQWPLHIIFTSTVLSKYNKLFKFLLRVKRTQIALQNLWALQMQNKCSLIHPDNETDLKRSTSNLMLRMHMSHLVDSLQYYVQADVLESHFSNLLSKIRDPASTDFEQIIVAHDNYVTALLAQCFILSTPVLRSFLEVLDICQQFCEVVTASIQSGTTAAREVIEDRVENLAREFKRQSSLLFHTLSAVSNQQCNPHLAQFLLLLDYNKYYSQNN